MKYFLANRFWTGCLILGFFLLVRGALVWSYQPLCTVDSPDYLRMAEQIRSGDFSSYDGKRTPAYPILLVLCGRDLHGVWFVQMVLGACTLIFLLDMVWRLTNSHFSCLGAGLCFAGAMHLAFMEAAVLTETLALFLCTCLGWSLVRLAQSSLWTWVDGFLVAIVTSVLILTRPLFLYVPFLLVSCICWRRKGFVVKSKQVQVAVLVFVLPMATAIAWGWFNSNAIGHFTMSTNSYTGLLNHAGRFVELARPEYAELGSIYVRHRELQQEQIRAVGGSPTVVLAVAYPEMAEWAEHNGVDLAEHLKKMSLQLFYDHPWRYLSGVLTAWINFWRVPLVWSPELMRHPIIAQGWLWAWWPVKAFWWGIHLAFLIATTGLTWSVVMGKAGLSERIQWILAMMILGASGAQALMEFSENARYALPLSGLTLVVVSGAISVVLSRWRLAHNR